MKTPVSSAVSDVESRPPAGLTATAECCKLLAVCFYPPDEKLLREEAVTDKLAILLQTACPAAAALVPHAAPHLEGEAHVALSVAYTRLFWGPPAILASPYATFYLDGPGAVMGPASIKIKKIYASTGLRLDDAFSELPDHVAVVLEFLYYLLYREAMAESGADARQTAELEPVRKHFLDRYVKTWIPRFCGRVIEADQHPFYNGLARCLDTFIQQGFTDEGAPS